MGSLVGRKVTFTPTSGGTPVIGARTKTITLNNEGVDITSDDDEGFRTYLAEDPAMRSIDMTVEGILKDSALIELAAAGGANLIAEYEMALEGIGAFTGNFHFGSMQLGAPYNDAVTFSATIGSSGAFSFEPETT